MANTPIATSLKPGLPSRISMVLLSGLLGLFAGMLLGSFFVEREGMAGSASLLLYGLVGLCTAAVAAFIAAGKFSRRFVRIAVVLLLLVAVLVCVWVVQRMNERQSGSGFTALDQKAQVIQVASRRQAPVFLEKEDLNEAGVGIVKPRIVAGKVLHFYGHPEVDELPDDMAPLDSLTFVAAEHFTDIGTAPPWFWPKVMKLDYDLLLLSAITLSKDWVEVVVNRETGLTRWVDRNEVEFVDWCTFLLDVYAVEVMDAEANPLRVRPLAHAGILAEAPDFPLRPLAVKGDWLMVSTLGLADRIVPTGWIRWREGEKLLVKIQMLS